jgi:hypothetical protein
MVSLSNHAHLVMVSLSNHAHLVMVSLSNHVPSAVEAAHL